VTKLNKISQKTQKGHLFQTIFDLSHAIRKFYSEFNDVMSVLRRPKVL